MFDIRYYHCDCQTDKAILFPDKTFMHTNARHLQEPFLYLRFSENENLCIVSCLKFYIGEQNQKMNESQGRVTILYRKPHKEASSDTLSRWIKREMSNAGIQELMLTFFEAHSCRVASTSKARQQGGGGESELLKSGYCSRENMFTKFYDKDIIKSNHNDFDYSSAILSLILN